MVLRSSILKGFLVENFLTYPLSSLPGVGPRTRALLKNLVGDSLQDLLFFFPTKIIERLYYPSIREFLKTSHTLKEDSFVTFIVKVAHMTKPFRKGVPLKVHVEDPTGSFDLMFFNSNFQYLQKKLSLGQEILVSGRPSFYGGKFQMNHPDYIGDPRTLNDFRGASPVYPLTAGLSNKIVVNVVQTTLKLLPSVEEWLSPSLLKTQKWPSWREALLALHNPLQLSDLSLTTDARNRLAYDEILAQQLTLLLSRHASSQKKGIPYEASLNLRLSQFLESLPFELTSCQKRVFKEISLEMSSRKRMLRLLQGDVGSGKTVVAFLAALQAIDAQAQVAFLVPTEILAQQHFKTISPWAEILNLSLDVISGSSSQKKQGKEAKQRLEEGSLSFIIGTHALLEDDVTFKNLGLVIVDEQHRFGVEQRLKLFKKGKNADILAMSATPIPRTLQLINFGDMDLSLLHEKPKHQKPITTCVLPINRLEEVINAIRRTLEKNQKVYWVCPLIEESEALDLTAAQERFSLLQKVLGEKNIGLLHGKMKPLEKEAVMADFIKGITRILVSTTVIEVGIDIQDATLMIIEHAERFGLSQLHQLRGRVGRGMDASLCLLLYTSPLSHIARQRLNVLRETTDGFKIAEEDLRLRGAGDLLGTSQSGYGIFKIANLDFHHHLLEIAQQEARLIFETDPHLLSENGQKLRQLLLIFNRLSVLDYVNAG